MVPIDVWDYKSSGTTDDGGSEIKELFGAAVFDTPKPTKLIQRMLGIGTTGQEEEIVVDFFAGSCSTPAAVLKQNAEDGGNRRFVAIQIAEPPVEGTAAATQGFLSIAEIGKERIRRVGKKILEGECHSGWNRDIGIRVLKIDTSNMADIYYAPDALDEANLDLFVDNIKPDRKPEDLLFQVMLDWGVDLALPITKQSIQGKDVFFVDGNVLAASFDASGSIDEAFVKELAKHQPLRVVFRDAGYKNSAVKINVEQLFKLLSPVTEVKCI